MKTIILYANFGCLAAEKKTVYTYGVEHCHAVCSDRITVKMPEGFEIGENNFGETIIKTPDVNWYTVNELLYTGKDDLPCFRYFDGYKPVTVQLEVVESEV